jgi:hypothetical protein
MNKRKELADREIKNGVSERRGKGYILSPFP